MKIIIENEAILNKYLHNEGVNLFLGAGFSYDAKNRNQERLPLGDELKEKLLTEFCLEKFSTFNLAHISQIIKKNNRGQFHRFLGDLLKVYDFDPLYKNIDLVKIRNIFSVNIDNLVERIFEQPNINNILYDVSICGKIDNAGIDFHKLHGSVTYPIENELLFTPEELSNLFSREMGKYHSVALKIASHPTIFWGTSLDDANILSLISKEVVKGIEPHEKWIVVPPKEEFDIVAEYFKDQKFHIIRAYTIDFLEYLGTLQLKEEKEEECLDGVNQRALNTMFSSHYIESIIEKKHPVRPLKTFFSGQDPVWHDIIENRIIKLTHYNSCKNKILSMNRVFITGGIGTGKSTLLMQLSIDPDLEGLKFHFNGLTKIQAERLLKFCNYKRITVFLDNICNNLDAFLYLKDYKNVKIICSDRDINYDMIKHKIEFNNNEIIDITELSEQDKEGICILANNFSYPKKDNLSLFEMAYYVWNAQSLSLKIQEIIDELEKKPENHKLLEFYTLMTYVRRCGISASMDMILLYYSDKEIGYKDIYEYVNRLSSIIDDSDHFTIGDEQDFFTLRSKLFAELSLERIPSVFLSTVLIRFVKNVHKDSIVRYDIFKRNGYDADIAIIAFKDVSDGKKYYDLVLEVDHSEYRYQQYALYLYRKKKYREAWEKIEIASSINKNNLAIRNTHAYILFNININIDENLDVVKETLDETFFAIQQCISKDLRKTFHVITYAENALRYYEKFHNSIYSESSRDYIDNAKMYIHDEFSRNRFISYPNRQKLRSLRTEIDRINR